MVCQDHCFLGLALSCRRFADLNLALVVGMLEFADLGIELGRLLLQLGAFGGLLPLALLRGNEPLLGIGLPLAPFGLLARRCARPFAVGGGFPSLGRGFV